MELTITETGLIGLVGMLLGFLISCCKTIEQSRCTDISFCGASCSREPLKDETILNLQEEGGEVEMKNIVLDHSDHRINPLQGEK